MALALTAAFGAQDLASAAQLQDRQCRALKAEYSRQAQGAGNSAQYQRYANAVREQTRELGKTRAIYRAKGCRSARGAECRSLASMMNRMERNITKLSRTRDRLKGGVSPSRLRALKARVDAACTARPQRSASVKKSAPVRTVSVSRTQPRAPAREIIAPTGDSGTRTVCVRLCDGYFFPVAFHPGPASLENDAARCTAMCPGTPTALYKHTLPNEETEDMISVATGEAYTALQTAFAYKQDGYLQSRPAQCSCRLSGIVDETETATTPRDDDALRLPEIAARPDRFADPETRLGRLTGLTPGQVDSLASGVNNKTLWTIDRQRRIRVVGGVFLPLPEAAEDLAVQGPNPGRSVRF